MYKEIEGDIFSSGTSAIVNPSNCQGIMESGLSLKFRRKFPEMYAQYRKVCEEKRVGPGNIFIYRKSMPRVLNFALKMTEEGPLRSEMLEACVSKLAKDYWKLDLESVAIPLIRPSIKLMSDEAILKMMRRHFENSPLSVMVYVNVAEPERKHPETEASSRILSLAA